MGVDDESDGSLSWRQSPGSVTRDSIVHSYTGLPLKEAYTTHVWDINVHHIVVAKEWIVVRWSWHSWEKVASTSVDTSDHCCWPWTRLDHNSIQYTIKMHHCKTVFLNILIWKLFAFAEWSRIFPFAILVRHPTRQLFQPPSVLQKKPVNIKTCSGGKSKKSLLHWRQKVKSMVN